LLAVLSFLFGPAIIATAVATRMFRRAHLSPLRIPLGAKFALLVLAIASCYIGAFTSFNRWGT
jgi:hypothetical protein